MEKEKSPKKLKPEKYKGFEITFEHNSKKSEYGYTLNMVECFINGKHFSNFDDKKQAMKYIKTQIDKNNPEIRLYRLIK